MLQTYRITEVLGMQWDVENDYLSSHEKEVTKYTNITKRQILKITASIYGQLCWFTPIILREKLMLQVLWREGKGWDEEISSDQLWKTIEIHLEFRCICCNRFESYQRGKFFLFYSEW